MKIYGLVLIKNEADIIASVLKSAIEWCDKIIVFDNGSTDDTWQIVQELSKVYPQIVPYISDDVPFYDSLRSKLFNDFKHEMNSDDWWCVRMDGDEFYIDNPREFLSQVPFKYKQVAKASIDYKITSEDIEEFDFVGDFGQDRDKIRYYEPYTWAETRFIRHHNRLSWKLLAFKLPYPLGMTYPNQIRVAHYKYRSLYQMQERNRLRKLALKDNYDSFSHEVGKNWEDYIWRRENCIKDPQDGSYPTLGNRNKVRRWYIEPFKSILTFFGYYG